MTEDTPKDGCGDRTPGRWTNCNRATCTWPTSSEPTWTAPTVGDNVANAIYANSGNGMVYNGAIRDIEGMKALSGFTSFVRSYHPSHHNPSHDLNTVLMGINVPIRIGSVMVVPGDVVLGKEGGVSIIPAHLAEKVVKTSEVVRLRDMFGHQRLREKKYTAGQIDSRWSDDIEKISRSGCRLISINCRAS